MTIETKRNLELKDLGIKRIEIEGGRDFLIAVANNETPKLAQNRIMLEQNGRFPIAEISIDGSPLTILAELNGLKVVPESERKSRSPGSQGIYLIRSLYNNPAVQVYYLGPDAITSSHFHIEHRELIKKIAGNAQMKLNGFEQELLESVDLNLHDKHMFKGGVGGAVIACVTYGPGDCFAMDDHHYIQ